MTGFRTELSMYYLLGEAPRKELFVVPVLYKAFLKSSVFTVRRIKGGGLHYRMKWKLTDEALRFLEVCGASSLSCFM